MILLRILKNIVVLAIELAMIAAVAWAGWKAPVWFALSTGLIAFVLGLSLERARLTNELTFYLGGLARPLSFFTGSVALGEAAAKGLLGGLAALVTFSGTDTHRLSLVAAVFAACLFAGTSVLRRLRLSLGILPDRWGYFRLAPVLGLLFSGGIAVAVLLKFIPVVRTVDLGRELIINTPQRPTLEQASELLFLFKQYFDDVVASLLSLVLGNQGAAVVGILLSVNMLTGFVVAIYAVLIAKLVQALEGRN